jgi:GNAT superfamily N-acetyltransferase
MATITMIRPHLDDLPTFMLPAAFSLCWYRPGDEARWVAIQSTGYRSTITLDKFAAEFGGHREILPERQCYLLDKQGQPIGTATAWLPEAHYDATFGRIHWVAIVPDYRGRGLAKPLMTAVCQRLKALSHTKAYLTTSDERPVAVHLYREFGFTELLS